MAPALASLFRARSRAPSLPVRSRRLFPRARPSRALAPSLPAHCGCPSNRSGNPKSSPSSSSRARARPIHHESSSSTILKLQAFQGSARQGKARKGCILHRRWLICSRRRCPWTPGVAPAVVAPGAVPAAVAPGAPPAAPVYAGFNSAAGHTHQVGLPMFCNKHYFCILRRPAHLYEQGDLKNIMLACIILHNMIIKDEKDIEQVPFDLNEEGCTYIIEEATISHGQNPEVEEVINRNTTLRNRQAHKQLQSDLIDHIWQKFGNKNRQNN